MFLVETEKYKVLGKIHVSSKFLGLLTRTKGFYIYVNLRILEFNSFGTPLFELELLPGNLIIGGVYGSIWVILLLFYY